MQIPFNSLIIRKGKAKRHGTDQILDLKNIEKINWVVHEMSVPPGTEGTIWLDEVSFY